MTSGVYRIRSISTGKFYIGSSQNLEKREARHFYELENDRHHNVLLQKVCDRRGIDDFVFEIIRYEPIKEARAREAHLLTKHVDNKLCVNIGMGAVGVDNLSKNPNRDAIRSRIEDGVRKHIKSLTTEQRVSKYGRSGSENGMYGREHTEASRRKMSESQMGHEGPKGPKTAEARKNMKLAAQRRVASYDYVNSFQGKTHNKRTKAVLSEIASARAAKGILPSTTLRVKVGKRTYRSASAAVSARETFPGVT